MQSVSTAYQKYHVSQISLRATTGSSAVHLK